MDETKICCDIGQPILFRTTSEDVYRATMQTGSLWLRSAEYYRGLEDEIRKDQGEGVSSGRTTIPLRLETLHISGSGGIGQAIIPHYILSLHGHSISNEQRQSFGARTFGIRNLFKLTMDVFHEASQFIECTAFRYGPIAYRYTTLSQMRNPVGSAAIQLAADPPLYLNPTDTDVLRKLPIAPFIEQDEWRIVLFTNGYIDGDPNAPLRINVRQSHFYPYQ